MTTNLHDPTKAAVSDKTMNYTIPIAALSAMLRVRRSPGIQIVKAVLVLGVDNARAPARKTA